MAHKDKDKIREYKKQYYKEHADERREYNKQYRKEHADEKRNYRFKRNYGIEIPDKYYQSKLTEQENRCAICNKPKSKEKKALALDHDHRTNVLRGILCDDCNKSLGHMERRKINGLWFINALEYLIKYNSIDVVLYKSDLEKLLSLILASLSPDSDNLVIWK